MRAPYIEWYGATGFPEREETWLNEEISILRT